jgi:hypothetical protein
MMQAHDPDNGPVDAAAILRALLRRCAARSPDWFDGLPVPQDIQARILGDAQLCDRLARQVADAHELVPLGALPRLMAVDARLVAEGMSGAALDRAGLIWWSGVLATEVRGPRAGVLRERFGADVLAWALAQRDLSAGRSEPGAMEELLGNIAAAGRVCHGAWLESLPPAWRAWLALAADDAANGETARFAMPLNAAQGAAIVHRVARHMAGAAQWEAAA